MAERIKPFTSRSADFFGLRPDQTVNDFESELAALTEEDRRELADWLNQADMTITQPTQAPDQPVMDSTA